MATKRKAKKAAKKKYAYKKRGSSGKSSRGGELARVRVSDTFRPPRKV